MADTNKKLYVVGIGPGAYEDMTLRAIRALEGCELIVGYTLYAELIRAHFPGKEFYVTPMRGETERCGYALEAAAAGRPTAIVCSGDAGVYGMAGLVYELRGEAQTPEIEVIPGLTAACTGAALLGAPLTHDFAVISLSDLLTDWADIEKRLDRAAEAGFSMVLYNPRSRKRQDHLRRACDIVLRHGGPERACGVARNIGREGETFELMPLSRLREYEADMFTTVFIGNPDAKYIGGKLVTPRGYKDV